MVIVVANCQPLVSLQRKQTTQTTNNTNTMLASIHSTRLAKPSLSSSSTSITTTITSSSALEWSTTRSMASAAKPAKESAAKTEGKKPEASKPKIKPPTRRSTLESRKKMKWDFSREFNRYHRGWVEVWLTCCCWFCDECKWTNGWATNLDE